ncbi:uncharacterized protein [Ptychodera flava]|uniref:uncharacterized protein n=1 Tax=Ptychodera flava TaxID=63121 RepID=UPI00396A5541
MSIFLNVQKELKGLTFSDKTETVLLKRLKKACQTRWLSFGASVDSACENYVCILMALKKLEADPTAQGLLMKINNCKFLGALYILREILPSLCMLSKSFQRGNVDFSHIKPRIEYTKDKLQQVVETKTPITKLRQELERDVESMSEMNLTPHITQQLESLLVKYVNKLVENIDNRFEQSLPILTSFTVFDPAKIPAQSHPAFKTYGDNHIDAIGSHYFQALEAVEQDAKKCQLLSEWRSFKYHLLDWKPECVALAKASKSLTATDLAIVKLVKIQEIYPLLSWIGEICITIPMSNAWPERGASAVKRIKTRLRNRLDSSMLNVLLHVTIMVPVLTLLNVKSYERGSEGMEDGKK